MACASSRIRVRCSTPRKLSAWAFWGLGIGGLLISCCAIVVWLIRSGLYDGPKP
ncbi:MAG TPA: hypothetical protein VG365_07890 [Solirubrobacteraceae bacterium]|jgi:hypothetical protein|nr:hypothetical protein [Solirubrobacteraceae bacterium]